MLPELAAEFFGTLILLLFGNGVVAMVVLFAPWHSRRDRQWRIHEHQLRVRHRGHDGHLCCGEDFRRSSESRGHARGGGVPRVFLGKVIPYMHCADRRRVLRGRDRVSGITVRNFIVVDPGLDHTAGVFTTFPAFPDMPSAGLLDQTIGTAILVFLIFALIDNRNQPPQANLTPVLIGAIVVGIGMSFGGMHGYAINPARDFGPRLFTVVAGFKNNGLTDGGYIFWVPIVGPLVGGVIGGAAYDFGVRRFLPAKAA